VDGGGSAGGDRDRLVRGRRARGAGRRERGSAEDAGGAEDDQAEGAHTSTDNARSRSVTGAEALAVLRQLAAGVDQGEAEAGARRLLERIAARDDAAELRAALVELGARALVTRAA
jgi:hypothetical protein